MFAVTSFEDNIRVLPNDLTKPPLDAVTEVIEQRFINKVIADVGLVVTIYDIQSVEGGIVYPNDGAAYFKVCFRLVIFRPMEGGIIVGKLKSCNKNGLRLSLGFFDDVLVPDYALQEPSFFDDNEKLWLWKFEGQDMYLDLGQPVRFKVAAVKFAPPPTPQQLQNATGDDKLLGTVAKPYSPMEVMGDINGDGLGLTSWWGGQAAEEGDEGEEGGEQ